MTEPDDGNSQPGGDPGATASYWVSGINPDGSSAFTWRCDTCNAMGYDRDEPTAISMMNQHMERKHAESGYVAVADLE